MNRIFIGTSGFSYPSWKNLFYPEKLASGKWLEYYCTQFNTLELNNTFYRFPVMEQLKKMAERTPDHFRLNVKAHKVITHSSRMKNAKEKIDEFTDVVTKAIGRKLHCILYQLPPSYSFSEERLQDIITQLPHESRNVIEFRHESWWQEPVYKTLKKAKLTFCSVSYPGLPEDNIVTSNIFYKRMHGVPKLFQSSYSATELQNLSDQLPEKTQSYIYFNNTTYEAAYTNARQLISFVNKEQHAAL